MDDMTIAAFAREGGVGVETVRYYQRRGLIAVPERGSKGGRETVRRYGSDDLRRLGFIRAAQAAGFTLEQIRELLDLDTSDDRPRARELARQQMAVLDKRIGELQAARASLDRLARDCATGGTGPCPILSSFEQG